MEEIKVIEEVNNLRVSVDWIALTCGSEWSEELLVQDLGFTSQDFEKLERGANGYRKQLKHLTQSIRILYDGNEDMGVHLIISGSAIGYALKSFISSVECTVHTPFGNGLQCENLGATEMQRFLFHLSEIGKFTRLDIAIDDLEDIGLSPDEVSDLILNGQCVSKFRTCRHTKETDFQGDKKGQTVYFGSGQSNFLVRLYDKKLEQESKGNTVDSLVWYRWELELKKEYADRTARSIGGGASVSSMGIGILTYYVRFVNLDNASRSRCSMHKKWDNFVKGVLGSKLYVAPPKKTIRDKYNWIEKQVSPSLSAVFVASGADINTLYRLIDSGWERAKKPLKRLVQDELSHPVKQLIFTDEEIEEQIAEAERKELIRSYIQKEISDCYYDDERKNKYEAVTTVSLNDWFKLKPRKNEKRCKKCY